MKIVLQLLVCAWTAAAQAPMGSVSGRVFDPSRAIVPGASVTIRNVESGFTSSAVADPQGRYGFEAVPEGSYQASAAAAGFEKSMREVSVVAGQVTAVDFALAIGENKTVIQVNSPAITLESQAIVAARSRTSDSTSLLSGIPGLSLYENGGLSRLPVIHGLADDRVKVLVNGMSIVPACSNHMNPPSSYIDPSNVGSIHVLAGITPVSAGGDSIGGTISIDSAAPQFAAAGQGLVTHGSLSAFHRSNGAVNGGNASLSLASENFALGFTGSFVKADNYTSGAGLMVKSTFYEAQNDALLLAVRRGVHVLALAVGFQYIPQQGFVNARMDMAGNQSKFARLEYDGAFPRVRLHARMYYENTRHAMNILRDKIPGMNMPMDTRGANLGYAVQAELPLSPQDTLRAGAEWRRFTLDDWWPPVSAAVGSMGPGTLWNVRNGRRDRFGTYIEWEGRRHRWTELLGARSELVRMDTDNVAGYNMAASTTGSAAYYADALEFNSRNHHRRDVNFDLTALTRYEPGSSSSYELGYARKTRSPQLYERYLWVKRSAMSANMNGWFGDANAYTGNLELRPEVAHIVSATLGWHDGAKKDWEFKLTPYYTQVQNYIDVDRCPVIADGSNGCTAARFAATSGFVTLQFANHPARLYGIDGSGRMPLGSGALGAFALRGVLGYERAKNLDTGDSLYHIMPLNAKVAIEHRRGNWSNAFDVEAVDAKSHPQAVRNELSTPGYALLNVRTSYLWDKFDRASLRLDAGIDNLADRNYVLPLGGRYWIGDKTGRSSVPGLGRSLYAGLALQF